MEATAPEMNAPAPSRRTLLAWLPAWLPVVGLIVTAAITTALIRTVAYCIGGSNGCVPHEPTLVQSPIGGSGLPFAELRGRLYWSLTVVFYTVTVAGALVISTVSALDALRSDSRRRKTLIGVGIGVGIVVVVAAVFLLPGAYEFTFNKKLFQATIYKLTNAEVFVDAIEIAAAITFVVLALAATALLRDASRRPIDQGNAEAKAIELRTGLSRLRHLLFVGALALVAGTLQTEALYSWAMSLTSSGSISVPGTTPGTAYYLDPQIIPQTMTMISGTLYSLVLAAIFVPGFLLLRRNVLDLSFVATTPEKRATWLKDRNLDSSLPKQLSTLAGVLAPIIVGGPFASLLEALTK